MIIRETLPYKDGPDVVYFKDARGATPICRLARVGDHWEVLFYRGPSNLGPYRMPSEAKAKRGIDLYLAAFGHKLVGPLNAWSQTIPQNSYGAPSPRPGQPPDERVPVSKRRTRRRSR